MSEVIRTVCRVEIASSAGLILGTGFLLGPSTVITNYHVVEDVITKHAAPGQVTLRFDRTVNANGGEIRPGVPYRLASNWLIDSSPLADLDYALLRVDGHPGDDPIGGQTNGPTRRWLTPVSAPLQPGQPLFVVQHPQGRPMEVAFDVVLNVTPTRVTYRTNTEGGSSGSPAFSDQWDLLALHHVGAAAYNEGIPFSAILARPLVVSSLGT
jgi:V8-like Glu-specific endopeptidase